MKIQKLLMLVTALLFAGTLHAKNQDDPGLVKGKPLMLFICSGQSNMGGGGHKPTYNKFMPEAKLPRNDIWYINAIPGDKKDHVWVPLGKIYGLGPETSFAVEMAKKYPDHTICILKISKGATPITYWAPGKTEHAGKKMLESLIPKAINDLKSKVENKVIPGFTIGGFVWMQGEGDANGVVRRKGRYHEHLVKLLNFINEVTGQKEIPLVLGRISIQLSPAVVRESGGLRVTKSKGGDLRETLDYVNDGKKRGPIWYVEQLESVRTDQERFCKEYPRAQMVNIDDLTLSDGWHYPVEGYVEMGKRFANGMIKLLLNQ